MSPEKPFPPSVVPQNIADTVVSPSANAERHRLDEAYTWLRKNAPLARIEPEGYHAMWAVTRRADIIDIERNAEVFRSGGARSTVLVDRFNDEHTRAMNDGKPSRSSNLVSMDGATHHAHRRLTSASFSMMGLRQFDDRITQLAEETAEKMFDLGDACDFATDVSLNFPLQVIMELLGVPREDEPLMLTLTQEVFGAADSDVAGDELTFEERAAFLDEKMGEFRKYFAALIEDRKANPRDEIATLIANAEIDGEPISLPAALGYFFIIATAGHDTTSSTISSGMWQLAANPDQLAMLKDDLSLVPGFVEECVRWETPVRSFMRNNVEDVEVAGQKIPTGEWFMLCFLSGNRDEDVFDDPFTFDLRRPPRDHIGYGHGPHVCLGKHLASLEMQRLWEQIIPRLDDVELAGTPTRVRSNFVSGPKSVPIRYSMR
ncbi:MAG: cytochrome P450 [Acidimicrobiales bacterium]